MLALWDDDEDGDPVECMVGVEYELTTFVERLGDSGAEALIPAMEEVFDAVLGESDEVRQANLASIHTRARTETHARARTHECAHAHAHADMRLGLHLGQENAGLSEQVRFGGAS